MTLTAVSKPLGNRLRSFVGPDIDAVLQFLLAKALVEYATLLNVSDNLAPSCFSLIVFEMNIAFSSAGCRCSKIVFSVVENHSYNGTTQTSLPLGVS